jgi:hypothetical protein
MEKNELNADENWSILLSDDQRRHINEGIVDEENGQTISSEEFWKNLKNGEHQSPYVQ